MDDVLFYSTGNSHTRIAYENDWLVLDLGSGHNPHPRADVLVDKFLLDDPEISGRSGRDAIIPDGKLFLVGDVRALPFKDKSFDLTICSHVAEHIENIDSFCCELIRVSHRGYIETPSKLAEILRHPPYHIWYVSVKRGKLIFESAPKDYPLKWIGKLFFSVYFYKSIQLNDKDVFSWAYGILSPWDKILLLFSHILRSLWVRLKFLTYTRFFWTDDFEWELWGK